MASSLLSAALPLLGANLALLGPVVSGVFAAAPGPALVEAVPAARPTQARPAAPTRDKAPTKDNASAADPKALAVVAGVQRFYEKTAGFQASFTQVVKKKGLPRGVRRKGKVWLQKAPAREAKDGAPPSAGKMRWDYPSEEVFYFSDGEVLWSYERRERLAIRIPVRDSKLYQATSYLVGEGSLLRDFVPSLTRSTLPDTIALRLVPRDGTRVMKSLTLVVDDKTFAVRGSILEDPLGDSTTLLFDAPSYGAIDDKVFAWKPPPGVKVRKL